MRSRGIPAPAPGGGASPRPRDPEGEGRFHVKHTSSATPWPGDEALLEQVRAAIKALDARNEWKVLQLIAEITDAAYSGPGVTARPVFVIGGRR